MRKTEMSVYVKPENRELFEKYAEEHNLSLSSAVVELARQGIQSWIDELDCDELAVDSGGD